MNCRLHTGKMENKRARDKSNPENSTYLACRRKKKTSARRLHILGFIGMKKCPTSTQCSLQFAQDDPW